MDATARVGITRPRLLSSRALCLSNDVQSKLCVGAVRPCYIFQKIVFDIISEGKTPSKFGGHVS